MRRRDRRRRLRRIDGQSVAQTVGRGRVGESVPIARSQSGRGLGSPASRRCQLLAALQYPSIDRPGRLIVLIGRLTFSAAGNFATEVEAKTGAVFVGESMGSSPNMYGDVRRTPLPSIGLDVYIASIYWQKSTPDDPRITIEPDVAVPYSSDDYFNDRDPQLEAAIQTPVGR